MYGRVFVMMNWIALEIYINCGRQADRTVFGPAMMGKGTHHCTVAAKVPDRLRRAPGKISAATIHGTPFKPKDQKTE